MGITISNSHSRFKARVFFQKHSLSFVGNVGIYSVGAESVYQIVQSGRTECLAGVSREGLTREILARHSCLHLAWLFTFQSCARHMLPFMGCLVASYSQNLLSLQLLESSHSLSLTHNPYNEIPQWIQGTKDWITLQSNLARNISQQNTML